MADGPALSIKAGDKVRVQYHPPVRARSFVEGVVCRTDVSTLRGRVFVVDVTYEAALVREQPVEAGYQNYVLYERWEEFSGRIEVLTEAEQVDEAQSTAEQEPKPVTGGEQDIEQGAMSHPDAEAKGSPVGVEGQDGRRRGSRIASIFGRQK